MKQAGQMTSRRGGRGPSRRGGGFTLLELLVAMGVTLLLVVAMMRIFTATANTWQHGEAQVDAYREARGALQLMARDLGATLGPSYATALPTPAPAPGAAPAPGTGPLLPTLALLRYNGAPTTLNDPTSAPDPDPLGPGNEEAYCLTNLPPKPSKGTLSAVGYYCAWMPTLPGAGPRAPRAYALMRQALDSDGTFLRLKAAASRQPAAPAPPMPLLFRDLYARAASDPALGARPAVLAAFVWDLRFRIDTDLDEAAHPDGNAANVPVDHAGLNYGPDGGPAYPANLPRFVEIRFKALSSNAARRLEGNAAVGQADWKDADPARLSPAYQSLIRPNAQQFVLRVPLLNAAPSP